MSQRSKLTTIMLTTAAVMVATFVAMFFMRSATIEATRDLLRRRSVIDHLQMALSSLKDTETGQRGYLLTGDESYLRPYRQGVALTRLELLKLAELAKAGELREPDVARLSQLAGRKLDELEETIDLRRKQGLPAALAVVHTNAGKQVMDSMRALIAQMTGVEESALADSHRRVEDLAYYGNLLIGCVTLLNLAVLAWAYRRIKEESNAKDAAATELRRQKELIEVTLTSIGDAVIVTDIDGRITFLNEVAEALTGWKLREAMHEACAKVFRIINEDSRQTVESPVDKVLRSGIVMGLANHTLLIRKDGVEIPIDDSGAPIKEPDGNLRGVVLIFRDFSQHKAAEKQLIEANDALETANQAKDHFLAALSHELRTPLTPVLATLTAWEASDELPRPFLSDVQMLRRNVELEARLIDDLLDVTRIVNGKLSLNLELVDAHELLQAVVGMYRSQINAKRLNVSMKLTATRRYVKADSARLQQVFSNILNNAIKFTERDGHIVVETADDTQGRIALVFKDDGIGMTAELVKQVFEPFKQGSDINRYGGLGLGLTISKALIDMHAGVLAAASDGPGHGASFSLTLPSIQASTMRLQETAGPGGTYRRDPHGISILLVEDHEDSAEVMRRLLSEKGYAVETCATVADAAKAVEGRRFQLLVSDIGLPDGTGVDLIRQIRRHSTMPAIALTGFGRDQDITRYKEAGFDAHITKPVNFQKLEMLINQFFSDDG